MPERRFLLVVAGLFLTGAVLIGTIHVVKDLQPDRRSRDWLKYAVYVVIINGLWASAFAGRLVAATLLAAIVVLGAFEIYKVVSPGGPAAVVALVLFSAALFPMVGPTTPEWQEAFAFVVMVTATVDGFGELTGRLVGRRRLCPALSPGKTVEGLAGAVGMAVVVAFLLGFTIPSVRGGSLLLLGLMTAAGAVAGDLAFSALKRRAGVKDFSGVLPGHGGVLDRFDSLLVSAPVFFVARLWLSTS